MWDFFHRSGSPAQDGGTASAHDSEAAPPYRQTQAGPRLPSRKSTAAIAAVVLLASIGLGAALPGGRAAGARSPLSASLLAALAAQRDQKGRAASNTPSSTGSSQPESGSGQEETSAKESSPASGGKSSGGKETSQTSPETNEGGSSGASGKGEADSGSGSKGAAAPVPASLLAQIQHVWVISLSGDSFAAALASQSSAPYLTKQLIPQGTLLAHYSLVAASPAANDIALLSGQGPNPETEKGCPTYTALTPATLDSKGLAEGSGCVYPSSAHTLADQAAEAALTWRAYIQDMAPAASGSQSAAAGSTCRHPVLGGSEPTGTLSPGNDYQLARNPFVFFDSLIESQACTKDDVDLTQLSADLASSANTPNLSWIVPAACDDGAAASCGEGVQSGLAGADAFLKQVVPEITATADYKQHGLILIAFDSDTTSSQVGALVISPFVNAGKRNEEAFNTYSLLRSLDRLFGVPLLGHAADQGVSELNTEVYRSATNTTLARTALARTVPGRGTAKAGG
ncbi:MAG TPA: alkaline phosphatase family protein [Solirubrobacteraceae bacterium]|jgi:hypothetical protein|nr:alkaline phosphatase family protein [Solirubrobacteraceae bacterium]